MYIFLHTVCLVYVDKQKTEKGKGLVVKSGTNIAPIVQ